MKQLQGRTVVVTGARGFLGSHLCAALVGAGARVIATVRDRTQAEWLVTQGMELREAEVGDRASLERACAGADAVVANAGLGSYQGDEAALQQTNVEGLKNTLLAARSQGISRVIQISSVAIYRTRLVEVMDENSPGYDPFHRRLNWSDLTTDWRYARSKTLAERMAWEEAEKMDLSLTALRPGPIYGSRDPKATAKLIAALQYRVRLVPTVGIPWVHAGDVAAATVASLVQPVSIGKGYILAGPPISLYQTLHTLRAAMQQISTKQLAWLIPLPVPFGVRYNTAAAARDLGFVPRSLAEGMAEVVQGTPGVGGSRLGERPDAPPPSQNGL